MKIDLNIKLKSYKDPKISTAIDIICKAAKPLSDSITDPNVFVILKLSKNYKGLQDSRFSHVADPVDMQDYPVGIDDDYAYYRTDLITLRVRSFYIALRVVLNIKTDVDNLVKQVNFLDLSDADYYYL